MRLSRTTGLLTGVLTLMLLLGFAAQPARAIELTTVEVVPGNPSCTELGYRFGFKPQPEPPPSGTYSFPDGINAVTILSDGTYFEWSSTLGIDAVVVKGGPNASLYIYDPEALSDTGLSSPINSNTGQPYAISHIEFCYDYELTASKTATAEYTRTYSWEITKSVIPDSHTGYFGDAFTSSYDVFVDQIVADSDFKVSGEITINNPTPYDVDFSVSDSVDGVDAEVSCPITALAAGASVICSYEVGLSGAVDGTNTAVVASENVLVDGATAEAAFAFGDPTTIVGFPTINVTDYFDGDPTPEALGSASGDFTFAYDRDFACPTDEELYTDGVYTADFQNVAEIDETGQQAEASVKLTCYKPAVTKDAETEWFEQYEWTITKAADPDSHSGFLGDTFVSSYDVTVDQTISQFGYRAYGRIYVYNPSGEAITVAVADAVGGITASVDCDGAGSTSLTVPAGMAASCNYTVDLPDTSTRVNSATVSFNGYDFQATADVIFGAPEIIGFPIVNVTDYFNDDPIGAALGSASGDFTFEYDRDFACPTDEELYTDGVYTTAFPNTARIDETGQQDDANVDLTCYVPAEARVLKTTIEGNDAIGQFPFVFNLYDPSGSLVESATLGTGGGLVTFDTELRAEGTWTVMEVLPDGWVSTTNLACDIAIAYPSSANQTYVCEFDNVEQSRIDLIKLTNGLETTSQTWSFALYEGPDGFGGSPLASDSTPPALLDFGSTDLNPFTTYTLCELQVPAGYSTFWQIDTDGDGIGDVTVVPYNPNADENPPEDLGNRCVDFGASTNIPLVPGTTLHWVVDNQAPGGNPRTPGYWKNWNACTGGNQQFTASKNGGWQEGFWLLEDVLDPTIGGGIIWDDILPDDFVYAIETCEVAVDILDKRLVDDPAVIRDGRKVASDPLHNLATHLLAAQLNFGAGACTTADVLGAALTAEQLLDAYNFDGNGHDPLPKKSSDADLANMLADYLDRYNNGEFCGDFAN